MMQRKTKIICTIGPAINSEAMLTKMFNAGMNVARLNFSHGTMEESIKSIMKIRNVSRKMDKYIGIILDTKGPEIRTGKFENDSCSYECGDIVELVPDEILGNKERFQVNCKEFFDDVKKDDKILIDDGKISLTVLSKGENFVKAVFDTPGTIKNKKGINVPNIRLSMPFVSDKDYKDIEFGCAQGVDIIALSFVRRKEDVLEVRKLLEKFGKPRIEIVSKIENQEGVDNIEEILEVSNGIMVARGDLGVEVSAELVPIYQKKIIKLANKMGKPVITATHMLESMINSPRPTRAEASDVANAILDGSDAIMLSGESAVGMYPVESVIYMDKIARAVESTIDYRHLLSEGTKSSQHTKNEAIGICVAQCCLTLENVAAVFAFTETGGTAKRICKFRPSVPIVACTDNFETCCRLSYYWGVYPTIANYINDISMCDTIANEVATSIGIESGSSIILTSGFGQRHGVTNTIRIIEVE